MCERSGRKGKEPGALRSALARAPAACPRTPHAPQCTSCPKCLLSYPPGPAPTLPPAPHCLALHRDIEDKPRFLVGVQVDVTEHPTASEATPVGMQAASAVGQALQNMNW